MIAPQLTDASTSSEWFRAVAESGTGAQCSPSQTAIDLTQRRRRFVRLVTYMMVGLIAFTLLGVASFAWRHYSMRAALDQPVPLLAAAAAAPTSAAALAVTPAVAETEAVAAPPKPVAPAVATKQPAKPRTKR